jgi:protein tyrosine phosphatase (PTP) superfamily phosphohydrolase (DUF442 family)
MYHRPRPTMLYGILLAGCLLAPTIVAHSGEPTEKSRPADWAAKLDRPGLPNLHKVSDGLYRGAQPTAEGIHELKKLGVKTILSLRAGHSDKDILGKSKIGYEHIPMKAWHPTQDEVVRFLQIVGDKRRRPVFVHCQHGADRTGTMCAVYRVVIEGWTKQQAIDEMTKGGFGFHSVFTNLPKFIEDLDVEKVKEKAGLKK